MNTFGTPRHTRLRFLAASDEDGEPTADPGDESGKEPGNDRRDGPGARTGRDIQDEQDIQDERDAQDAAQGRYARLPGRDPIDLEAISDLSLD